MYLLLSNPTDNNPKTYSSFSFRIYHLGTAYLSSVIDDIVGSKFQKYILVGNRYNGYYNTSSVVSCQKLSTAQN